MPGMTSVMVRVRVAPEVDREVRRLYVVEKKRRRMPHFSKNDFLSELLIRALKKAEGAAK
jgi:hypothetical protein